MKKTVLYISMVMICIYAIAIGFVILGQNFIKEAMGITDISGVFILPAGELLIYLIGTLITILFNILLQKTMEKIQTSMENAVIIISTIWLIICPWILEVLRVFQSMRYSVLGGDSAVADYAVVHNALANCTSILSCAMILLIIFAAISVGSKNERKKIGAA